MSNLKNYNFNKIDTYLSESEYYDFYLAQDEIASPCVCDDSINNECLVVHYDFNNPNIYSTGITSANTIYSLSTWSEAFNTGHTFETFGLTGIDNGYIEYIKEIGDNKNTGLTKTITGTTTVIPSGDTRLTLNIVSGYTGQYIYPTEIIEDYGVLGDYLSLCGGFYQGYYKLDGYSYEVLPTRVPEAWVADFWLNKTEALCSSVTGTTLNDKYPNNKGFFFYMGTRAENKYWNVFSGNSSGCVSGCTSGTGCTGTVETFCTVPKETDVSFVGSEGFPINLSPPPLEIDEIRNQFLIYGYADENKCHKCGSSMDGYATRRVCEFSGDSITVTAYTQEVTNYQNPFLVYGQAGSNARCGKCGHINTDYGDKTVCDFSGFTSDLLELDKDNDIVDNAIGFRVKDDGSIGYRYLSLTGKCDGDDYISGVTVNEEYSLPGVVKDDEWTNITIRFTMPEYDECDLKHGDRRKGKLMFYINSKLKFVSDEVDEFIAKRLYEYKDKQLGVPFNISLGGGSQGLLESMTFDGQDPDDLSLIIENNFAGTFIGNVSQFKFFTCNVNWCEITHIYNKNKVRYN
tara:strand:+ start:5913 stop:7628 length:1716 start_codon:yes stop_codon:yes gene_type:complete